jgi:hypothetical protein
MSDFAEFIKDFCVIAVTGGLVTLVSPNGKLRKHVKFIISLCMVCALASTLISVSDGMEGYLESFAGAIESEKHEQVSDTALAIAAEAKKNIEAETAKMLCARFGFSEDGVYVIAEINAEDTEAVEIVRVNVFIADTQEAQAVRSYVSELFGGAAEVSVMRKGN